MTTSLLKPICPLAPPTHGEELWKEVEALFERHNMPALPYRLRDELVNHLAWARYGAALAARQGSHPHRHRSGR